MIPRLDPAAVRVGINPIGWSNDDFQDLGADIGLERCLEEARAAGFAGVELGHKFPRRAAVLGPVLARHGLALVSGWHSTHLLEHSVAEELRELEPHLDLLAALGARVAIVAECSRRTYTEAQAPLRFGTERPGLTEPEWRRLSAGLEELAAHASGRGLDLAYHHHTGTVIQEQHEIEALLERTRALRLLLDTGHLALAGIDPGAVCAAWAPRLAHVHLKDVRSEVRRRASSDGWSFERAVREGVFAVPGQGGVDFDPVFAALAQHGYTGWLVVEAEQDPALAEPLEQARRGREAVRRATGL